MWTDLQANCAGISEQKIVPLALKYVSNTFYQLWAKISAEGLNLTEI